MNRRFVNRKDLQTGHLETVDEVRYVTRRDVQRATDIVNELRENDAGGLYFLSTQECHNWRASRTA